MSCIKLLHLMILCIVVQSFDLSAKDTQEEVATTPDKTSISDDVSIPDDVKKLLISLHSLCDTVMQKAVSSKDSEEVVKSWNKQDLYHQMRRDIMSLNRKRYIQKLKNSKDFEDRALHGKLKELYRDLLKYDKELEYYEPSGKQSRKQSLKHRKKTEEFLQMLEKHIEHLIPVIKKFLHKHSLETKKLAAQAEERKKLARTYEEQAAQKNIQPKEAPQPTVDTPAVKQIDADAKSDEDADSKPDEKEDKTADQDIIQVLNSHMNIFPYKHEQDFVKYLHSIGNDYPLAHEAIPLPSNALTEENWLYSKDQYKEQGFDNYQRKIMQNHQPFTVELEDMKELLNMVEDTISSIEPEKLQNISSNQQYQTLASRVGKYKQAAEYANEEMQKRFHVNIDTNSSPIYDPMHIAHYKTQHDTVRKVLLDKFYNPILKNEHAIAKVNKKITLVQSK